MPPRLFVPAAMTAGAKLTLPAGAARHVQVLRLQPGAELVLFNGQGGEWSAQVAQMDRRGVQVDVATHVARECELATAVTLTVAMPANERMDFLVEKASELGVAAIQPLVSERSVLRLSGERAERKRAHWQAIAVAACEQCGRNRVPALFAVQTLSDWLAALPAPGLAETRWLLGWNGALPWSQRATSVGATLNVLSGPEGGFNAAEEAAARGHGFVPTTLGERVLRADTAPLAVLAAIALASG